jgi:glycosyltransferase involved in cell wall biosynthesis
MIFDITIRNKYFIDKEIGAFDLSYGDNLEVTYAVPNNNGMSRGLPQLISSIKRQKNVIPKIVIVDSGSEDNSVCFAIQNGCIVLKIKPEDFNHSASRNMALSISRSKYTIFTVNDAFFNDEFYTAKAIELINKFNLVAVSGKQITPHDDYYSIFNEYLLDRRFPLETSIRITADVKKLNLSNLKSEIAGPLFGIDNVNALYLTDVLKKYGFSADTVEDMSIAKTLVQDGHRIGITKSICVVHGHTYDNPILYRKRVKYDLIVIRKIFHVKKFPGRVKYLKIIIKNFNVMFARDIWLRNLFIYPHFSILFFLARQHIKMLILYLSFFFKINGNFHDRKKNKQNFLCYLALLWVSISLLRAISFSDTANVFKSDIKSIDINRLRLFLLNLQQRILASN